jgi:hypothetical protein
MPGNQVKIPLTPAQTGALRMLGGDPEDYPLLGGVLHPHNGVTRATMQALLIRGLAQFAVPGRLNAGIKLAPRGRQVLDDLGCGCGALDFAACSCGLTPAAFLRGDPRRRI